MKTIKLEIMLSGSLGFDHTTIYRKPISKEKMLTGKYFYRIRISENVNVFLSSKDIRNGIVLHKEDYLTIKDGNRITLSDEERKKTLFVFVKAI
jgi:hypothetical protein